MKLMARPPVVLFGSMKELWQWIWIVTFAIAFAWVESSAVVYLREISFGGSFSSPFFLDWENGQLFADATIRIELVREIATILILVSVGWAAGKNALQKFCFFMIVFGIWDIFYYIWLWAMVRWPDSLMSWDLLFIVPLPWVAPVITPLLIALAMVVAGLFLLYYDEKGYIIYWRWYDWGIELICAFLVIVAFCWDWKNILHTGIPNPFAWWLYLPAYLLAIVYFGARLKQIISSSRPHLRDPQAR
ncbi:MAG: hypothetical protein JSW12_07105 [Deltaproteobacteria bacterium]|nr:MAG: hypothetical protein JSW12_07105 [Deltaproteobacteria bacterium]